MKHLLTVALIAAALSGCSLFGSDEPSTLDFHFWMIEEDRPVPAFRFTFDDGGSGRTLERDDFDGADFKAGPFEINTRGHLRLACSVVDGEGRAATTTLRVALYPDWEYDATCAAGPLNPYRMCFGCKGYAAQPLDHVEGFAPGDSLYLVWAGDPSSRPNIY